MHRTEQQASEARSHLQEVDKEWVHLLAAEPIAELQSAMENAGKLRAMVQEQVFSVELQLADNAERLKAASAAEAGEIRKEQNNARARLAEMRDQLHSLDRDSAEREKLLAARFAHRDTLEADRKAGQAALADIEKRLREVRGESEYRGERLKIIDPGVVPERPSSPNIPLNIGAALLAGLVLPILYLTFSLAWNEQRSGSRRRGCARRPGRRMNSEARTARFFEPLGALAVGGWAAAIALAPGVVLKVVLIAPAVLMALLWWTLHTPSRWIAALFVTALLLPPLPIPVGDSGPHLCLILAGLGLISGLLWVGKWRVPVTSLNGSLIAITGVLLASVAAAAVYSGPEHALGSLARVALFAISVYVYFYTAHGPGRFQNLRLVYWTAVAAAAFACVDFYFQLPAPAGYGPQFVWLEFGRLSSSPRSFLRGKHAR